jgi:DNA-binding transcriptional ArsR family regulator
LTIAPAPVTVKQVLDHPDVLDRAFHALADPSRRQMLDRLARGSASVSELAEPLQMSLAAVVQHVQVLEASGLVESRKTGRVRTCSINEEGLGSAEQWLADRRAIWQRRLDRLGAVLDEQAASKRASLAPPPTTRKRGRRT